VVEIDDMTRHTIEEIYRRSLSIKKVKRNDRGEGQSAANHKQTKTRFHPKFVWKKKKENSK